MNALSGNQRPGRWQLPVFVASLVMAAIVWVGFPEPEESRQGYTAAGCYARAREHFAAASVSRDIYRRSQLYAAAIKYLDALEKRFGVSRSRWDAYEMLGDANVALADVSESARDIAEQLRLESTDKMRRESLRAFREAIARVPNEDRAVSRLERKEAEVLLALDRPVDALQILGRLISGYRASDIERLRQERESGVTIAVRGKITGALADEVRTVYFLAGEAAQSAKQKGDASAREARESGHAGNAEDFERSSLVHAGELERAFTLFLNTGGSGDRKAIAHTALGDLEFERARLADAEARREALGRARDHYRAAGTPEAAFLMARSLFALGEYEAALRRFRADALMQIPERRARRYMAARCYTAMGLREDARGILVKLRSDDDDDAEAAAAAVDLSEIALDEGNLENAASLLLQAVRMRSVASKSVSLPERDVRLESAGLVERLISLAEGFEGRGVWSRAIELYRRSAEIDPNGPAPMLRRIAEVLERGAKEKSDNSSLVEVGLVYLELADAVERTELRTEARLAAAESLARGGAYAKAIVVAREFIKRHGDDKRVSRMMHGLGTWESKLGLLESAAERFESNLAAHPRGIYSDRSRIELARVLASEADDDDLLSAARLLREILADTKRYDERALVRLEALFLLGSVDVRLAGRYAARDRDASSRVRPALDEALDALDEALGHRPEDYPSSGGRARPLFAELIARYRAVALLDRGEALHRLGRDEEASACLKIAFDEGAGPFAALYESLAGCLGRDADEGVERARDKARVLAPSGDEAWAFTCAALERLESGDETDALILADCAGRARASVWPASGMLSPRYWQQWSKWIAARVGEGAVHARSN